MPEPHLRPGPASGCGAPPPHPASRRTCTIADRAHPHRKSPPQFELAHRRCLRLSPQVCPYPPSSLFHPLAARPAWACLDAASADNNSRMLHSEAFDSSLPHPPTFEPPPPAPSPSLAPSHPEPPAPKPSHPAASASPARKLSQKTNRLPAARTLDLMVPSRLASPPPLAQTLNLD